MSASTALQPRAQTPEALVTSLVQALGAERRQIEAISAALLQQRQGVAKDDVQIVDDTAFAIQRTLVTLQAARTHRRAVCKRLTSSADTPLRDLDLALGPLMTDALRSERDRLVVLAHALVRDLAINRRILQEALDRGNVLVHTLAGGGAPTTYSGPNDAPGSEQEHVHLIDRRV